MDRSRSAHTLVCPGSKSMTQRALIIGALSEQPVWVSNALVCDDSRYMSHLLRDLGCGVTWESDGVRIEPKRLHAAGSQTFCGNAGTAVRFGSCLSLVCSGMYGIDGDEQMRTRPIGALGRALTHLGVDVRYPIRQGFPPVELERVGQSPQSVAIEGRLSSQYASGIMMVAPALERSLTMHLGDAPVSQPYLKMTATMMERAGAQVSWHGAERVTIQPSRYTANRIDIEPDWSTAALILAAGTLLNVSVDIAGLTSPDVSVQGDAAFATLSTALHAPGESVLDLGDVPDLIAPLAALAPFADAPTELRNVAHARAKECDRIAVLVEAMKRLGIGVREFEDGLRVKPVPKDYRLSQPVLVDPHHDHRMAMAFALLRLRLPGIVISDPSCVSKSFPTFWNTLTQLRCFAATQYQSKQHWRSKPASSTHVWTPVLVGMRGAGKSTVGVSLAHALDYDFVDADACIEHQMGMTIADLFAQGENRQDEGAQSELSEGQETRGGEARFREREKAVLLDDLLQRSRTVVATGGGAVLNKDVRNVLAERDTIWLNPSVAVLAARIAGSDRPSLTGKPIDDELAELISAREPLYREVAQLQLSGEDDPAAIVEKICSYLVNKSVPKLSQSS